MIPRPAQYLLRFDDLCPTMSRPGWMRFKPLLEEFGVKPILAVVPDNRDADLEVSGADVEFWSEMRAMEAAGASIGLHGYRHLSGARGQSLVPMHRATEFAGIPEETQRAWIRAGLEILRGHGLNPCVWVAPRHGFDGNTLRALRSEGLGVLSDGFARVPFVRGGVTWIPQQLWAPVEKRAGLWTMVVHANSAPDELVGQLRAFLEGHVEEFTSVERVVKELRPERLGFAEGIYETMAVWRLRTSLARKRWLGRRP